MDERRRLEEEMQKNCKKKLKIQRESESEDKANAIGNLVKIVRNGDKFKNYYTCFEYDGNVFELGNTVLMRPESPGKHGKPYAAIIKAITKDESNAVKVTVQWFYRPEDAAKSNGGNYIAHDNRELYFSFHCDEEPAESVMHKCVVHFIPVHKQLPIRSLHPGFIVQKVYDFIEKKLWNLTERDFEDEKQREIGLLVEKTRKRIGDLPNMVVNKPSVMKTNCLKSKRIDVSRVEPTTTIHKLSKAYASSAKDVSKYHVILSDFKVLTGEVCRDKWLERLLQGLQLLCNSKDDEHSDDDVKICWPDAVIPIITSLERVTHEALGNDFQKYNPKMRQLEYNLKTSALLFKRLLKKELEPIALLTMTPDELKEGLTSDERITFEPEMPEQMQMTDVRCSRCSEKQVGVKDIINAGGLGDRYQLECIACGHTWYASRDTIALMATNEPNLSAQV